MTEEAHYKRTDDATGAPYKGHEWDGIEELDNPLPKWWLYTLWVTVIWSLIYFLVYPSWPIITAAGWDYTKGFFGYSQRATVTEEVQAAKDAKSGLRAKLVAGDMTTASADAELYDFALAAGEAAFGDNCAPCHGSGAQGFKGFPNLNDDDWLWGGKLDDIYATIAHGVRWDADFDSRFSVMPAFISDEILETSEVDDVTHYVRSLSGAEADPEAIARGAETFAFECAICHSETGVGDRTQGAPNLTDAIWLYGDDFDSVRATIANSRNGTMPAWAGRLDEATLRALTIYVHSRGGGE